MVREGSRELSPQWEGGSAARAAGDGEIHQQPQNTNRGRLKGHGGVVRWWGELKEPRESSPVSKDGLKSSLGGG